MQIDIQTALNQAQLGDTVTLEAGRVWDIGATLILYRKTTGSGMLTIRTSTPDTQLPAPDTRITPAWTGLLPTLRANLPGSRVFTVEQSKNTVSNYQFLGLNITSSGVKDIIDLVRMWAPGIHTTVASTPDNIVFDRCLFRGHPLRSAGKGIRMHVRNGQIKNSFFDGFNGSSDTQAISNFNGPGPLIVRNNYLSATGENMMTGGAKPDIPGLVPANHTVEFNAFVKDPAQQMVEQWQPGMFVLTGKVVIKGRGKYKALDSGTTGASSPAFPITVPSPNNAYPLTPGFVRAVIDECVPASCVTDNGIRWQLIDVTPQAWSPNLTVRTGDLISYKGPQTSNKIVIYYAAQNGVTGSTPPFAWPMRAMNPSPGSCSLATYCITDGSTKWQRYQPSSQPGYYTNKNLLEFKVMSKAAVRWNFFSGSWTDGQSGYGISLKPENQDSSNSWISRTENVEVAHNIITNVERPFVFSGRGDYGTGVTKNLNVHDNLMYNLRPSTSSQVLVSQDVYQLRFSHNTLEVAPGATLMTSDGRQGDSIVMTDNLLKRGYSGFKRSGTFEGNLSLAGTFRSYTFLKNVMEGMPLSKYPPGNFDTAWSAAGLVDPANDDFRLLPASPYRNAGTDGKDIGADHNLLPTIRNFSIQPSDRGALFSWDLGTANAAIPCVIELSGNRDMTVPFADVDPVQFVRPDTDRHNEHIAGTSFRMIRIGKNRTLSPNQTYWYRLQCGGDMKTGSIQTTGSVSGNKTVTLPFTQTFPGADRFTVEYGYSYSRSANQINGVVATPNVVCVSGAQCTGSVSAVRGQVLYYRFIAKNSRSAVVGSSPFNVLMVN